MWNIPGRFLLLVLLFCFGRPVVVLSATSFRIASVCIFVTIVLQLQLQRYTTNSIFIFWCVGYFRSSAIPSRNKEERKEKEQVVSRVCFLFCFFSSSSYHHRRGLSWVECVDIEKTTETEQTSYGIENQEKWNIENGARKKRKKEETNEENNNRKKMFIIENILPERVADLPVLKLHASRLVFWIINLFLSPVPTHTHSHMTSVLILLTLIRSAIQQVDYKQQMKNHRQKKFTTSGDFVCCCIICKMNLQWGGSILVSCVCCVGGLEESAIIFHFYYYYESCQNVFLGKSPICVQQQQERMVRKTVGEIRD